GSLLDGLNGSIGTGLNLTVYATLDPSKALIKPRDWLVQATILGTPLTGQGGQISTNTQGVSVQGTLDRARPGAPAAIAISARGVDLLNLIEDLSVFDLSFDESRTFLIPVPIPVLSWLGIHGEVALTGEFDAILDSMTVDAKLAIKLGDDGAFFDPA